MDAAEFSLRLQEFMHKLDFWVNELTQEDLDQISEAFGTPRKTPEEVRADGPEELNIPLVDLIAQYIVEEEELLGGEDPDEDFALKLGNFIYGWSHWAPGRRLG